MQLELDVTSGGKEKLETIPSTSNGAMGSSNNSLSVV